MTTVDPERLLSILREAAELINEVYANPFEVQYKSPGDPVTVADRRANELICRRLGEQFPGAPVVAEESEATLYANYQTAPTIFFVDPVDGTREFVRRNGEFVTMIGVVEGERPSVGVILQPTTGDACLGVAGHGAWEVRSDGRRTAIRVSKTQELAESRLVASRSGSAARYEAVRHRLGVAAIVPLGSAGMKALAIARGEADAYAAPGHAGHLWDTCALEALVVASGGRCTDSHGAPIDYRGTSLVNDRGLLASNGQLHEQLLRLLVRYRAEQRQENSPT